MENLGNTVFYCPTLSTQTSEEIVEENRKSDPPAETIEIILKKRNLAVKELISTEEKYINDLSLIVNGYIAEIRNPKSEIPMPEDLRDGKERMVFGNVIAIYEWHRDIFLKKLENCVQNPSELGAIIKTSERKLHMYVVYCQNKPVSEYIVTEHLDYFDQICSKLNHQFSIRCLLMSPVQRIMRYKLLLDEIYKYTMKALLITEAKELEAAIEIMTKIPKAANDMMDAGRLQNFEGKITAQGKLLLHETLMCTEATNLPISLKRSSFPKPKEFRVFLFEQNIIFSEIVGKKTQFTNPSYIYRSHIQVNKMKMREEEESGVKKFIIESTDPKRSQICFSCTALTNDLHDEWVHTINKQLQKQLALVDALTDPKNYL